VVDPRAGDVGASAAAAPGGRAGEGRRVSTPAPEALRVPQVGRIVVLCGVLAHLYAAGLLLASVAAYRSAAAVGCAWAVSAAIPLVVVARARRHGDVLGPAATIVVGAAVLLIDVVVLALVEPAARAGYANWAAGALGLVVLGLAAYRPPRDILALGALHFAVTLVGGLTAGSASVHGVPGVLLASIAAILPPLVAAQFLHLYAAALRTRQQAVAARARVEAASRAQEEVRREERERLARLRAETAPLLDAVAAGAELPLAPEQASRARELAAALRAELVANQATTWLTTALAGAEPAARVEVVDGARVADRLDGPARARLLAVVQRARECAGGDGRVVVALAADSPDSAVCVVTAAGAAPSGSRRAQLVRPDAWLTAAVEALAGSVAVEEGVVVIEARLWLDGGTG